MTRRVADQTNNRLTIELLDNTASLSLSKRRLNELVEEAIIDAYGESEQLVGLLCVLQEHLAVPFTTEILGTAVRVERVDTNDADDIVAICQRGQQRQKAPFSISRCLHLYPTGGVDCRLSSLGARRTVSTPTVTDQD